MLFFSPAPSHPSSYWAAVWGQCAFTTRKPRRTSAKSTSTRTCPGELQASPSPCSARPGLVLRGAWSFPEPCAPSPVAGPRLTARLPLPPRRSADPAPRVLQNPVSRLQPQRGLFRLFGRSSEPPLPGGLLGTGHRQQGLESGSWQAAAVGHEKHEAAGPAPPPRVSRGGAGAGHTPGRAHGLRAPLVLRLSPLLAWVS